MKPLFQGIYNHFNTVNSLNTALSGRLYLFEADPQSSLPFCTYSLISNDPDFIFSAELTNPLIQFSLYSDSESADEVTTNYGYLIALFDDAAITVTGYSTVEFRRSQARLFREPETNLWTYQVDYEIILSKT